MTPLAAGPFQLQVHDSSTFHDFHLTAQGVDKSTEIDTKGIVAWTVTFTDGLYKSSATRTRDS